MRPHMHSTIILSYSFFHSSIHPLVHSLAHPLTHPSNHLSIQSSIHPFTQLFNQLVSHIRPLLVTIRGRALTHSCLWTGLRVCIAARGFCVLPPASAAFSAVQLHPPAVACEGLLTPPVTSGGCEHLDNVLHVQSPVCCPRLPACVARLSPLLAAAAQDGQPALHAVACTHGRWKQVACFHAHV